MQPKSIEMVNLALKNKLIKVRQTNRYLKEIFKIPMLHVRKINKTNLSRKGPTILHL